MPLHRGSAKAITLAASFAPNCNATAGVDKAAQPDGPRRGEAIGQPGLQIETLEFRRGGRGISFRSRALGKIVRAEALWADPALFHSLIRSTSSWVRRSLVRSSIIG
jgi:hypothetical protein